MSTSQQQGVIVFENSIPEPRSTDDVTESFEPLKPPGAAIFPQFVSDSTQTIIMKRKTFSDNWSVTYSASGKALIDVDAKRMSISRRKHLVDTNSGQELCELRRQPSTHIKYFGIDPVNGSTLFQTETHVRWSGHQTTLKFVNVANSGYDDNLEVKQKPFSSYGKVTYGEQPVASIKLSNLRRQYDLQIAPGLDPFLIVALAMTLYDKDK